MDHNEDLLNEMYVCMHEETPLWRLGEPTTDYEGDGRKVVHDRFSREDCSNVILRWFDLGWLNLTASVQVIPTAPSAWWHPSATQVRHLLVLGREDSRRLIVETDRWDAEVDGRVELMISDEGELHETGEWLSPTA